MSIENPSESTRSTTPQQRPVRRRRILGFVTGAGAIVAIVIAGVILSSSGQDNAIGHTITAKAAPPTEPAPTALTSAELAALTPATHSAVIPGLLAYQSTTTTGVTAAYGPKHGDIPVYGIDHTTPVAKLPATDFLGEPTVIVPVKLTAHWALILTPARQSLPSTQNGNAAAQTAGWVARADLIKDHTLRAVVTISASAQTLTITQAGGAKISYPIGVGTAKTPTPTGITGYIQARYTDPKQADYPIQLTSLHSAADDEPFGGKDGGLIGLHYNPTNIGAVSHGCIRLTYQATVALNQLPLGTPIVITK